MGLEDDFRKEISRCFDKSVEDYYFAPTPKHRHGISGIKWAGMQPERPQHILGDVVKCEEGGVGMIVKVSEDGGGWPTKYALDAIPDHPKPPRYAWYYDLDFSGILSPSALRNFKPKE